jgi:hypothetical protein
VGLNRFFLDNRLMDASMVYLPSSEEAQLPAEHLRDQLRQAVWQTQGPWVITEDNRRIDFDRGGVKVATIALGTYATGTALAAAIVTAMEAADSLPVWGCDYNVAATDKFRIRDAGGAPLSFVLLWSTGANAYRSIGPDLGFDVADSASVTTTTSDNDAYQSRHFIVFHQSDGSDIAASAAILLEHNFDIPGSAGVRSMVTIQGNATNDWSAPTFSELFADLTSATPTLDPCPLVFSTPQTFAYWRLVIDDVQNPDGFAQLGILYLGIYTEPSVCCSESLKFTQQDFSQGANSISGSGFTSAEPDRETFGLEYSDIPDASSNETKIDALRATRVGLNFFFQFDSNDAATLFYVSKVAGAGKQCIAGGTQWTYDIPLVEEI